MRIEDLITKLEHLELPEIEMPRHKRCLKMALLHSRCLQDPAEHYSQGRKVGESRRRYILLGLSSVIISLAIMAAIFVADPFNRLSGYSPYVEAAEILQKAQAIAPQQVAPGQVIHIKTRTYFRYGPAATQITAIPGSVPETTVAESWALIGPDGWPERSYATTLDDKGSLLLETFNTPTRSEVRNASGRLVFAADLPQGAESRNVEQENRNRYQQLIDERIAKLVGESVFNGRETFVIEWRTSQLPEGTVTVPYIADLNPVEILIRVEFEQDTYRPVKTEHYAIDEKGQQYLIHSRETLVDEVLEITNVPANVVQALGQ